nr:hypothetical protein [Tanacetum cinerariifolium]
MTACHVAAANDWLSGCQYEVQRRLIIGWRLIIEWRLMIEVAADQSEHATCTRDPRYGSCHTRFQGCWKAINANHWVKCYWLRAWAYMFNTVWAYVKLGLKRTSILPLFNWCCSCIMTSFKCLIIDEDFIKRLRSTLEEEGELTSKLGKYRVDSVGDFRSVTDEHECLIIDEDFIKISRSTLGEEGVIFLIMLHDGYFESLGGWISSVIHGWRYSWVCGGGVQNRVGNANPGQARQVKCYNCNGIWHIAMNCTQPKRPQNFDYYKEKKLLMQSQENGVALDEEQLLFLAGGQVNSINEDVDEQPAPTAKTMFMANLSFADPVNDEAGPSYDSDILSEVHDHNHYQDAVCEHHEEHMMHENVQFNYVVDSHADYTSDSNMILYDQYVKDNAVPIVHTNAYYVPNDAYMMIYNDMYEPHAQSVSKTSRNTVVDNSLTVKLATYKEQVELYERRARFELTEREKKINEQLRLIISDQEVTSLKKYFKQKENKYLEDFLDMKSLKEKVEDRLFKQNQSLQTVHMLYRPKPYYNKLNKIAIGYKNPLCLTRAKKVQPALYNGHEIIKDNHVPAIVHNTEDTLEIAEITRRNLNDKMKDPECVTHKVMIAPHDYSKENFLDTFTPHKQSTPEQIFWSQDIIKMNSEALKEHTTVLRPIKALTMYPPNTPATLVPRALIKEIKEMKDVFEELVAEVAQNVVDRKHDEIERKNLLIANDNLIAECLSKEVFSVAMNSELNVARFTEMHVATLFLSKDLVKPKVPAPGNVETIRDIVKEAKVVRPLDSSIISACRYTKHSQELLEYAIGTYPQDSHQRDKKHAPALLIRKKQVTFAAQCDKSHSNTHKHVTKLNTQKTNVPVPLSTGVNRCIDASGSQPRSNTRKNRISSAKGVNKMQVEEQPRTNKSHLRTTNYVDSSSRSKSIVINLNSDHVFQM